MTAQEQINAVVQTVREIAETGSGVQVGVQLTVPHDEWAELDGRVLRERPYAVREAYTSGTGCYVNVFRGPDPTEQLGRRRIEKQAIRL